MAALTSLEKKYGTPGSIMSASRQSDSRGANSLEAKYGTPESIMAAAGGRNSLEEKYGTVEEIRGLGEYATSLNRYRLGANFVTKYLQSENWDDNANHQWYTDLVSSRQEELSEAMKAAGDNRALMAQLQRYSDYYGSLAQGLTDREAFYSQFKSKADYDSYAAALSGAREARKAGGSYYDWYQTAQANEQAAAAEVERLEGEQARLAMQRSTGRWEDGVYMGEDTSVDGELSRVQAELEEARRALQDSSRQTQYAGAWRWDDLPEARDFGTAAAAGMERFEADSAAERARQEERRAQEEAAFNAMGTGGLVYEDDLMTQLRENTSWREPQDDWTEQERNTFGYLYQQDPERAYEYGQYINDRNAALSRYEQEQTLGEWADKNFFTRAASFGAGVLTMPAALADYLDYATEYAARGTVTQRADMSLADYGNAMVGAVSQGLNERYGTLDSGFITGFGWGDVYQLGVSVAQSMLWGGAGKALGAASGLVGEAAAHAGSAMTLQMFFGSAAKSGYEEAKARGADDGQALWYGLAAGVAEAGCEVVSLDKLLTVKSPTSLAGLFKNILTQAGVEASEELMTTLCNTVSDAVINGDKSEISTSIALGMAKGMSYEEAAKAAEREWLQGIAKDAIGGFLSGGFSGGMASAIESFSSYGGNVQQLIDQGLASGGEAEAIARDMQERMTRGETAAATTQSADQTASLERRTLPARRDAPIAQESQSERAAEGDTSSDAEAAPSPQGEGRAQERESEEPVITRKQKTVRVTNLQAQKLIEAIEETDQSKLKSAVEVQLTQMQEGVNEPGKNVSLIAEAVAKTVQGKKLNRVEEEALKGSHFGEHLVRELSAEKLMKGGSIPAWVRNIGAERIGGGLYSDVAEVVRSTLRGEGLKSTQGRVSFNGERVTFTRLEKNSAGETVALITKADGSTQQVKVSALDFGYNTLLEEAVTEMAAQPHGPAMMALYRPGQDLGGYIDAWQMAEIYGSRSGASLETAWEDAKGALGEDIEFGQFKQAFEMGRAEREKRIAEREKEKSRDNPSAAETAAPLAQGSQREENGEQRAGTVNFDGAEIDGVKYDAVDKSRLTSRQKRQIAALEELAKVTGVNIVFYQTRADSKGRFRGANGAFFNNTIYLDVNAGMRDSRDNLRVAIIRTAAHELTHYIKENNAEGYEALQSFLLDRLIEWKGRSLAELAEDKLARDTSGTLSMEQAIDEVVADGCEMMLRRSSVAEQLAREDRGLFEKISDWVKGWTQKIRDAFEGVEAYHDEAKAMEKHADELQKRWDAALLGAIRNDQSGQGTKNAAPKGGAQMQERDYNAIREKLAKQKLDELSKQLGDRFPLSAHFNKTMRENNSRIAKTDVIKGSQIRRSGSWFSNGKRVYQAAYGTGITKVHINGMNLDANLSSDVIRESLSKADTNGYQIRLDLIPKIKKLLENGHLLGLERTHLDNKHVPLFGYRIYNTFDYITKDQNGIVNKRETMAIVGTVVQSLDNAHVYVFRDIEIAAIGNGSATYGPSAASSSGIDTVSQLYAAVKQIPRRDGGLQYTAQQREDMLFPYTQREDGVQYQERDFMPDDRELLLEAAEGGQSGRELQEYRKKAQKLEEHQRRLQRLQEAAESAEGEEKDKITEKLRKTEKSILNAEAALRRMEATPQLKRALEKATAAWRDANPNEAAKTLRRLREQNRTQQELIEYWQQQARRTEPGKETLRKDDIRRVARALLKEHQSEADVGEVSAMLQELGDFMAQNSAGAGVSFYEEARRRAGRIARLIVRNIYQTEDSHAELRQEVRDYLRKTPIQITDYIRADMPELDYFRKKHMGVLKLNREGASLDEVYQSLGDQLGERWFPRDVTAPSDQLNQIVDALESLEPSYYEVYRDYEVREISEIVAGEIIDTLLSGDVRQSETVADRAYKQMQERLQRETEKQRQHLEKKDKRRQQALNDAQDEARYRYAELQDEKALRRQMVSEKVHELRERSITRDKEYKARIRIAKAANRLAKYLTENSKEKHVPEKFKAALGQFLLSVDTLSPRAGEKTQQMYIRQMNEIRRAVASNLAFMDGAESDWKGMLMNLPQDLAEVMEKHIDSVQAAIDGDKTWVTARMDLQQLQDLEDILTVLSKAITQQNELLAGARGATVSATAEETVKYLDALERAKADNALSRFLQWDNTTPYYFFKRFGQAGLQIFRELQNGWGKMAFNSREIVEFAEKTYSAKEVREAERKIYSFQLHKRLLEKTEDGNEALRSEGTETVRMSKAQVMELYALSRREQALGHMLGAGIRISDIQDGTKKITQAENYLLTMEELQKITGVLSERDRAIVDALQKYMNTRGTEWGNEVSMARFGIRQFTEEHYWPIKTDPRGRAVRDPSRDSTNLFRLLNMGFTKNTIRDASNSIVLGSAFDTFANHMADMVKYNALGLPLLDAMKWYSYNAISEQNEENGQYTTISMQKAAERALGKDATSYFITFMKDMNGTQEGGRGEEAAAKMLSNYKVAAVAANLRVAMLQPTAYVRAAAVLDPKYLAKGVSMGNKAGRDKAMKYSGTAVWKDMGFYDTNINTGLREMIKHDDKLTDQVREKSMFLAEWGDTVTWGFLWNACEAEVAEKQHLRGEELMRATAQRFDDVIYRTQVMDSTMTRSQNMRQKGVFAGMATSFMSEPTLSYNMVLDAYNDFRAEKRRSGSTQQAWRKTRGAVGRAMLSYVATAAAAAIVESLADALRDDDEYASFTEKWLEKMGFRGKFWDGNLWSDLAVHNKLPYLRDLDSMLHGFETNRLDMEWAKSVKKAWEIISETVKLQTGAIDAPTDATYNGRMTTFGKIYNVMKALSQLSGLPLGNTLREVQTVWNNTVGMVGTYRFKTYDPGPEKSIRYALKDGNLTEAEAQKLLIEQGLAADASEAKQTVYEWSLDGAGKYDALLGAVKKNDDAGYQSTLKELLSLGYAEKSISSTVKTRIREWYQGTEKEARSIDKAQAVKLLQAYGGMRQREAEETVQEWSCFVVTGIQYGELKEAYQEGQFSNSVAVDRLMRYGGKSREDANAAVLKWQCEKDTGYAYDEIREAYAYGEISEQQLRRMMAKYGGQSEENIDKAVAVLDFAGTDETLGEITGASALYYFSSAQETGIGKSSWLEYWSDTKDMSGDDRQEQIIAYIASLNLTPAQKDVIFRFHYRNSEKKLKRTPWHK